jgi:putative ABC transport system ATP-binding protein
VIELKAITRSYREGAGQTFVLRNVNLTICEGEFVSIMGPSGAGKSSLLQVLALLDDAWTGEYLFSGDAVHAMNRKQRAELARRRIGMIFQSFQLLDDLSVAENIDLPLQYKNLGSSERKALVADTLDRFGIVGKKDLFPRQLSGGQQQLVGIARALVHSPALLLADEPTGNLHSAQAEKVMEMFHTLHAQGTTIVQVTHSLVNAGYGSRIVELHDGWLTHDAAVKPHAAVAPGAAIAPAPAGNRA